MAFSKVSSKSIALAITNPKASLKLKSSKKVVYMLKLRSDRLSDYVPLSWSQFKSAIAFQIIIEFAEHKLHLQVQIAGQ